MGNFELPKTYRVEIEENHITRFTCVVLKRGSGLATKSQWNASETNKMTSLHKTS